MFGLVQDLFAMSDCSSDFRTVLPTWSCWLQFVPLLVLGLVRGHVVKYASSVMPPVYFPEQKP